MKLEKEERDRVLDAISVHQTTKIVGEVFTFEDRYFYIRIGDLNGQYYIPATLEEISKERAGLTH